MMNMFSYVLDGFIYFCIIRSIWRAPSINFWLAVHVILFENIFFIIRRMNRYFNLDLRIVDHLNDTDH